MLALVQKIKNRTSNMIKLIVSMISLEHCFNHSTNRISMTKMEAINIKFHFNVVAYLFIFTTSKCMILKSVQPMGLTNVQHHFTRSFIPQGKAYSHGGKSQ